MPGKNYIVELTSEERRLLKRLINTGKVAAYGSDTIFILLRPLQACIYLSTSLSNF